MERELTVAFGGGMNDSAATSEDFGGTQCSLILNGRIELDNSVVALGGSTIRSAASETTTYGRGIVEFRPTGDNVQLVKFTENSGNTTVTKSTDGGATWSSVTGSPLTGITGDWSLVTMYKDSKIWLLGACGAATLYKYDGTTISTSTAPTTGIKFLAVHNERLWAAKEDNLVYASKVWDYTNWTSPDGLALYVQTHDGDSIKMIGSAGPVLIVAKRRSTGYIEGYGNSDIVVSAGSRGISPSIGCIAHRTFQSVGNGYVWLSERGLEYFDGSTLQPIAEGVSTYWRSTARNRITVATGVGSGSTLPCSLYWAERQEYWIAWPSSAYTSTTTAVECDEGAIINLRTGGASKRVWNPPSNTGTTVLHPGAMCMAEVTVDNVAYLRPVVLTKGGQTVVMDYSVNQNELESGGAGGYPVDFRMRSRVYDNQAPTNRKWLREMRVTAAVTKEQTVTILPVTDGAEGPHSFRLFEPAVDDKPRHVIARTSGRGLNHQVEVRGQGGLKVSATEVAVRPMRGALF